MTFQFSWRVSLICAVLAAGMLRASFWQWERHQEKQALINTLQNRLAKDVASFTELVEAHGTNPAALSYHRVSISGTPDYKHEVVLRNRRHRGLAGVFLLTPLHIPGFTKRLLVQRGFIPLNFSEKASRTMFQNKDTLDFIGLIKPPETRRFLSPADNPAGESLPWVDSWLRVDIQAMAKQLPYPLFPFFVERMPEQTPKEAQAHIVQTSGGKEDIIALPTKARKVPGPVSPEELGKYPIAVFDTVLPPGRHLGYVYEWAIMAVLTLAIGLLLQRKRGAR